MASPGWFAAMSAGTRASAVDLRRRVTTTISGVLGVPGSRAEVSGSVLVSVRPQAEVGRATRAMAIVTSHRVELMVQEERLLVDKGATVRPRGPKKER